MFVGLKTRLFKMEMAITFFLFIIFTWDLLQAISIDPDINRTKFYKNLNNLKIQSKSVKNHGQQPIFLRANFCKISNFQIWYRSIRLDARINIPLTESGYDHHSQSYSSKTKSKINVNVCRSKNKTFQTGSGYNFLPVHHIDMGSFSGHFYRPRHQ